MDQEEYEQIARQADELTIEIEELKEKSEKELGISWFGVQTLYDKFLEVKNCVQSHIDKNNLKKDLFFGGLSNQMKELDMCIDITVRSYSLALRQNKIEDLDHVKEVSSIDKDLYEAFDKVEESDLKARLTKEKLNLEINKNRLLVMTNKKLLREVSDIKDKYDEILKELSINKSSIVSSDLQVIKEKAQTFKDISNKLKIDVRELRKQVVDDISGIQKCILEICDQNRYLKNDNNHLKKKLDQQSLSLS